MAIDRSQLRAFVTVLREGSFDAAARTLHLTAPAISQRIRQLEERLGQVLIRRGSPATATEAGIALARHAEQIDMLEAETLHTLHGLHGLDPGTSGTDAMAAPTVRIPVVVNADSLDTWFMTVLDALAGSASVASPDAPPLFLDIHVDDQDHTTAMLRDGTVIAAVTAQADPVQGCESVPLGVMPYLAVASPAFHARWIAQQPADALRRAPFLQFNAKDALQARFVGLWEAAAGTASMLGEPMANAAKASRAQSMPVRTAPCHRLPTTRSFTDACLKGLGWGMVPRQMAAPYLADGLLVVLADTSQGGLPEGIDVPLYWQRWALRSPVLQKLTDAVVEIAATVLDPLDPREPPLSTPAQALPAAR